MLIKLWNWEKQWSCQQVFEGHTHYVMQIVINPKDNNTFASASLDRTLKVGRKILIFAYNRGKIKFFVNFINTSRYGNLDLLRQISRWMGTKKV